MAQSVVSAHFSGADSDIGTSQSIHSGIVVVTLTGQAGSGKNFRAGVLLEAFSAMTLIASVTTRTLRPGAQDNEYVHVSQDEFRRLKDAKEFLWAVQPNINGNWYGTKRADVDAAMRRVAPSVMHLDHGVVSQLQGVVAKRIRRPGVFSFYVACYDLKLIETRLRKRDPNISQRELDVRLDGYLPRQTEQMASGIYHAVLDSTNSRSESYILSEMMEYLACQIPAPGSF